MKIIIFILFIVYCSSSFGFFKKYNAHSFSFKLIEDDDELFYLVYKCSKKHSCFPIEKIKFDDVCKFEKKMMIVNGVASRIYNFCEVSLTGGGSLIVDTIKIAKTLNEVSGTVSAIKNNKGLYYPSKKCPLDEFISDYFNDFDDGKYVTVSKNDPTFILFFKTLKGIFEPIAHYPRLENYSCFKSLSNTTKELPPQKIECTETTRKERNARNNK